MYRVAKGKSFFGINAKGERGLHKEHTPISTEAYSREALEHFVEGGYLVAGSMTEGRDTWNLGTVGADLNEKKKDKPIELPSPKRGRNGPKTEKVSREARNPETPRVESKESPWAFDPKTLEGKPLEALVAMVHEIDPELAKVVTNEKDAIEVLSQDFQKDK